MGLSRTTVHVFAGCCSSAFLMEILMARKPSSANLVTFLQFFFITLYGFIVTTKFGSVSYFITKIRLQLIFLHFDLYCYFPCFCYEKI